MILIDTDVVSGLMREPRDPDLVAWLSAQAGHQLAISAITVAEIRYGLMRLPAGRRRALLEERFEAFASVLRIMDIDVAMAVRSAAFRSVREASGRPISFADALIAATAAVLGCALATRNVRDFDGLGLQLANPWA